MPKNKQYIKCRIIYSQPCDCTSKYTGIGGAFTQSINTDDIIYFSDYIQVGDLNFVKDPAVIAGQGHGKGMHGVIISNGGAINVSSDFDHIAPSTLTSGERYAFTAVWRGVKFTSSLQLIGVAVSNPVLSNFTIENANRDRVYFDSNQVLTGTTFAGFTLASPTKTITGMTLTGTGVDNYLTVSAAYAFGDSPTIAYDGTDDISGTGGDLQAFTATAITNNILAAAPTITSQTVEGAAPNDIVVGFNEAVTATNVGYTPRVATVARNVTSLSGSGTNTLTLTIDGAAVTEGQAVDLSYDSVTGNTTGSQAELEDFTQTPVTNNVSAFAPSDLTNLEIWLDGTDSVVEAGTGVSQWTDKSGNNYHFTQITDSKRPTYDGTDTVTFNKANADVLDGTTHAANIAGNSQGEYFVVVKKTAADEFGFSMFLASTGNDTSQCTFLGPRSSGTSILPNKIGMTLQDSVTDNGTIFYDNGVTAGTDFYLVNISSDSIRTRIAIDGNEKTVSTELTGTNPMPDGAWINNVAVNTLALGALLRQNNVFFNTAIKEIIYCSSEQTAQDRASTFSYLNSKYTIY